MRKALDGDRAALLPPDRLPRHRREAARGRGADRRGDDHARGPRRRGRAHGGAGQRPVNALDKALRKALGEVLPGDRRASGCTTTRCACSARCARAPARVVRVLIESGDEHERWSTVGVSHNVIEASWQALVDSMDYKLHKQPAGGGADRAGCACASTSTTTPARRSGPRRARRCSRPRRAAGEPVERASRGRPGARGSLEDARAAGRGADRRRPAEIVFTSGATEANNLALRGVLAAAGPGAGWSSARSSTPRCSRPRARWRATASR